MRPRRHYCGHLLLLYYRFVLCLKSVTSCDRVYRLYRGAYRDIMHVNYVDEYSAAEIER